MLRWRRTALLAVLALTALLSLGCAMEERSEEAARQPEGTLPERTPASTVPEESAEPAHGWRPPANERAAVVRFAAEWVSRRSSTDPEIRRTLLTLSAGALHAALAKDMRNVAGDTGLGASESITWERLEGILLRKKKPALVVTRQTTSFAAGGTQSAYAVYLAKALKIAGEWRVVEWRPVQ